MFGGRRRNNKRNIQHEEELDYEEEGIEEDIFQIIPDCSYDDDADVPEQVEYLCNPNIKGNCDDISRIQPTTSLDEDEQQEYLPPCNEGEEDVEIIWNEDRPLSPKLQMKNGNGLKKKNSFFSFARFRSSRSNNGSVGSTAANSVASVPRWKQYVGDNRNVAIVNNKDDGSVETQHAEHSEITIDDKQITVVNPGEENRRRRHLCCMFFLLCLVIGGAIAAVLMGMQNKRNKSLLNNGGLLRNDNNDGNQEAIGLESGVVGNGGMLETGCFQYTGAEFVCYMQDSPTDQNCAVTVTGGDNKNGDGKTTDCECLVCGQGAGSVRVECDNSDVINDSCLSSPENYDGTILEAFVRGSSADELGTWIIRDDDGNDTDGKGNNKDEDNQSYHTGCLDYVFRIHNGATVCLFNDDPLNDEDEKDDVDCTVLVNGSRCNSCTICNPITETLSIDCSNLDDLNILEGNLIMNENCEDKTASNSDILTDTFMEVFGVDNKDDIDSQDGEWIDAGYGLTNGNTDNGPCVDRIETDYRCYEDGSTVKVFFQNCNNQKTNWVGIYGAFAPYETLGPNPIDWEYTCVDSDCESSGGRYENVKEFKNVRPGLYRAYLVEDHEVHAHLYHGYAWSDMFHIKESGQSCEKV